MHDQPSEYSLKSALSFSRDVNTRSKEKATLHEGAIQKAVLILHLSGLISPSLSKIFPNNHQPWSQERTHRFLDSRHKRPIQEVKNIEEDRAGLKNAIEKNSGSTKAENRWISEMDADQDLLTL